MAECKDCVKNVTCVERRYFGGNQKNCEHFKEKTYTLEEIAQKICDSYEDCTEGECPGWEYCRHERKGTLIWLRKVMGE